MMKTMKILMTVLAGAALAASAAKAEGEDAVTSWINVTDVTMVQRKSTQNVEIKYKLANDGEPAFVTFDILTNDLSIGLANFKTVSGDYSSSLSNTVAADGSEKTITWAARSDWHGNLATNAIACVRAYYTNAAGTAAVAASKYPGSVYMVIDISGGTAASSYPVSYSFVAPATNEATCVTHIWLKSIAPGDFLMGSTDETDPYGRQDDETRHAVRITQPFFAGVFPVTSGQYALVMGSDPSGASVAGTKSYCPANLMAYNDLRGTNDVTGIYNWPATASVSSNSFMGRIRAKTGMAGFDLPTEAQWECACRAGTTGAWNNGTTISTDSGDDPELDKLGWYNKNSGYKVHNVGGLAANAWGLYDMHGNVFEWCLDWYAAYDTSVTNNPVGPTTGNYRVIRGGSLARGVAKCRAAFRNWKAANDPAIPSCVAADIGFRLFYTVE